MKYNPTEHGSKVIAEQNTIWFRVQAVLTWSWAALEYYIHVAVGQVGSTKVVRSNLMPVDSGVRKFDDMVGMLENEENKLVSEALQNIMDRLESLV